jgi:hypothetical protein
MVLLNHNHPIKNLKKFISNFKRLYFSYYFS